jgi:hypothetical protein
MAVLFFREPLACFATERRKGMSGYSSTRRKEKEL